jgi:hypothetical protein
MCEFHQVGVSMAEAAERSAICGDDAGRLACLGVLDRA